MGQDENKWILWTASTQPSPTTEKRIKYDGSHENELYMSSRYTIWPEMRFIMSLSVHDRRFGTNVKRSWTYMASKISVPTWNIDFTGLDAQHERNGEQNKVWKRISTVLRQSIVCPVILNSWLTLSLFHIATMILNCRNGLQFPTVVCICLWKSCEIGVGSVSVTPISVVTKEEIAAIADPLYRSRPDFQRFFIRLFPAFSSADPPLRQNQTHFGWMRCKDLRRTSFLSWSSVIRVYCFLVSLPDIGILPGWFEWTS